MSILQPRLRRALTIAAVVLVTTSTIGASRCFAGTWDNEDSPTYTVDTDYSDESGTNTSYLGTTTGSFSTGTTARAYASSNLSGTNSGNPMLPRNSMFAGYADVDVTLAEAYNWLGPGTPTASFTVVFTGNLEVDFSGSAPGLTGNSEADTPGGNANITAGTSTFTPTVTVYQSGPGSYVANASADLIANADSPGDYDGSYSVTATTSGTWGEVD